MRFEMCRCGIIYLFLFTSIDDILSATRAKMRAKRPYKP
jgi:hypothetical protein